MTFLRRSLRRLPWLLVLVLALGAGACSQNEEGGWTAAADEDCNSRGQAIETWIDGFRHCERDADCEVTEIAADCVPSSFLCSTALSVNIDRAAFEREATAKQAKFEPACGCAIAKCVAADDLMAYCEPATKRCATQNKCRRTADGTKICGGPFPVSPPDSSTPDAGTADAATNDASTQDASASADAGPTSGGDAGAGPFACQVAADCEVKNVGNCCGYYPRCANKAAVFPPPQCAPGVSGVCGFPDIDECTCRENTCRSLQGGKEI